MLAAWLLSQKHSVTVYEFKARLGGHSQTVDAPMAGGATPVDMGFIVYNELNYPNLVALFAHLGVPTKPSNMGFSVSLDNGRIEYGGEQPSGAIRTVAKPDPPTVLVDASGPCALLFRNAPDHACALAADMTTLGDYLTT